MTARAAYRMLAFFPRKPENVFAGGAPFVNMSLSVPELVLLKLEKGKHLRFIFEIPLILLAPRVKIFGKISYSAVHYNRKLQRGQNRRCHYKIDNYQRKAQIYKKTVKFIHSISPVHKALNFFSKGRFVFDIFIPIRRVVLLRKKIGASSIFF